MNIRTPWTNRPKYEGKVVIGPSLTTPDLSMSILEILTRYQRGLPLMTPERVPVYMGENDLPDLAKMDLAEIEEMRDKARADYMARYDAYQNDLKAKQEAQRKNEAEARKQQREAYNASKRAKQGSTVQRTTGDADDQGPEDQPD